MIILASGYSWRQLYIICTLAAYSGRYCDEDVDGCADLSCFEGVECEDIPAPGVGAKCGSCPDGFNGNGIKCNGISSKSLKRLL